MSGMDGNPYLTDDVERFAAGTQIAEQCLGATILALAYEQRTTNLIAERNYWDQIPVNEQGNGWYDLMEDLQKQINARMDVGPKP